MRIALALLIALIAPVATAATTFVFVTVVTSTTTYSYGGTIAIDGASARIDFTSGEHPLFNPGFSVITTAGGEEILVLDHKRKTFFHRSGSRMGGHLSTARGLGRSTASDASFHVARDSGGAAPDGGAITHTTITARYRLSMEVEGETVRGSVELEAQFWTLDRRPQRALPWGLHFAAKTGFPDIDRKLAARIPERVAIKELVTVSRRIADGPAITERITTTTSHLAEAKIDRGYFSAPDGYRYEEPAFTFGH
jgi:hypothetical protein